MPMWSKPCRVKERILNSYKLETLNGQSIDGEYHARRLREFIPREGTELATQQKEFKAGRVEEVEEARAKENLEQEGEEDMDENERTENHNPEGVGNDSGEDIERRAVEDRRGRLQK